MDLDELPNETLLNILNHLEPVERMALRRVSKKFNDLVLDDPYWIKQFPTLNNNIPLNFMKIILPPWKIWIWSFWYNIAQLYTPHDPFIEEHENETTVMTNENTVMTNDNCGSYITIIGSNITSRGMGNTIIGTSNIVIGNFCISIGIGNLIVDNNYINNSQNLIFHFKKGIHYKDYTK